MLRLKSARSKELPTPPVLAVHSRHPQPLQNQILTYLAPATPTESHPCSKPQGEGVTSQQSPTPVTAAAPARQSAPTALRPPPAAETSAWASTSAFRASYPVSRPAARTTLCTSARKTSRRSTPGAASPSCIDPAESPDTRVVASTSAPSRPRKHTNTASPTGTASCALSRAPRCAENH